MTLRLPDFATSSVWADLRDKMGADEDVFLPELDIKQISLDEIKQLQTSSLSIENIKDHINPLDWTFDYKGQKVILYIKQQRYNIQYFEESTYKYHLCYCSTLEQMESMNRFNSRYVVTQRVDGKFLIDIIDKYTGRYHEEDRLCILNVCINCLKKLRNNYPHDSLFSYGRFDLGQFLSTYNTKHIKRPQYSEKTIPKDKYSANWNDISNKMRARADYRCSKCNESYKHDKAQIHVHHIDGVKWNNNINNLKVLCMDCHGKEPGHFGINRRNKSFNGKFVRNL